MSMIQCPDCGKMISEHAEMCIHCGCPVNKAAIQDRMDGMISVSFDFSKVSAKFYPIEIRIDAQKWKISSKSALTNGQYQIRFSPETSAPQLAILSNQAKDNNCHAIIWIHKDRPYRHMFLITEENKWGTDGSILGKNLKIEEKNMNTNLVEKKINLLLSPDEGTNVLMFFWVARVTPIDALGFSIISYDCDFMVAESLSYLLSDVDDLKRWIKYGEPIPKDNTFFRNYYRRNDEMFQYLRNGREIDWGGPYSGWTFNFFIKNGDLHMGIHSPGSIMVRDNFIVSEREIREFSDKIFREFTNQMRVYFPNARI